MMITVLYNRVVSPFISAPSLFSVFESSQIVFIVIEFKKKKITCTLNFHKPPLEPSQWSKNKPCWSKRVLTCKVSRVTSF